MADLISGVARIPGIISREGGEQNFGVYGTEVTGKVPCEVK